MVPIASYRKLIAILADDLREQPAASVDDVAKRWSKIIWREYQASDVWPLWDVVWVGSGFRPSVSKAQARAPEYRSYARSYRLRAFVHLQHHQGDEVLKPAANLRRSAVSMGEAQTLGYGDKRSGRI